LNAEREPVEAAFQQRLERRRIDGLRISLGRDLRVGGQTDMRLDRAQDPDERRGRQQRRGSSSEEHGGRRSLTLRRSQDVRDQRVDVTLVELVLALVGVEVAVVTAMTAERDVDVDAEPRLLPPPDRSTMRRVGLRCRRGS
jgi:hypothetical protein